MKLYKILILSIFINCSTYSQINLEEPTNENLNLWILAQNNESNIQFRKNHENDNRYSSISFRETIQNFNCHSFGCATKKRNIQVITLNEFNNVYRERTITFSNIKSRINTCKEISNYLNERAGRITYFVIEGNQVKIYDKAHCSVAIESEGLDFEEVD